MASASMSRLANSRVLPEARPRASRVMRTPESPRRLAIKQGGAVPFEVGVGGHDQLADRSRPGRGRPGRRWSIVRGPCPRAGRGGRAGRGRRPGTHPAFSRAIRSRDCSTTQTVAWSRRGSRQMAQIGWSASVRWKQTWQWRTWSLAARMASASSRASSGGHLSRWWASRSADLAPMPGKPAEGGDQPIDDRRVARARHGHEPSVARSPGGAPPRQAGEQAQRQTAGQARERLGRRLAGLDQPGVDRRGHQFLEQLGVAVGRAGWGRSGRRRPRAGR